MLRFFFRRRLAALALLLALVLTFSSVCYRALRARDQASLEAGAARHVAITFAAVEPYRNPAIEPIASREEFRDSAVLHGRLYLCDPKGLYGYDSNGGLRESYEAGRELPAGELVALGASSTELFVATSGAGVLVFDGTHFHQLLPADSRLRSFTAVLSLDTGRVLLGSAHGVFVWDGKTLDSFLPALQPAHITALAGSDADLWIGTLADGVWRLHAGELDHLASNLPDPHVLSIAVTYSTAYVGTPIGAVEFRDGKKSRSMAEGYFARALDVDDQSLAVGTEDEGIVTVPLRSEVRSAGFAQEPLKAPVERIFRMDGIRYALAGSIYAFQGSNWTSVLKPRTGVLNDRNVSSLALGHDGRVWVGYFDHGLDVASADFDEVRHFEDEHLFCVNRIVEDPTGGRTAVATANGLVTFDPSLTVRQLLGRKDGLLSDHVTDVLFRTGGMAIATPAGLSIAGPEGMRSVYVFHGLVNSHVYALAADGNLIAAGTLGGLSLLDRDVVSVSYTTANSGLKHNWISALARVGDEWFAGTYGAGVMQLDSSGHWSGFADLKAGFEVNPNAMAQSGDSVYVGSLGKGMWVYSRRAGRWRNVTEGLPSLNVTALAVGGGYVYAGTDNGLVRFREGDLR